jgi:adenylosuccinate synthase
MGKLTIVYGGQFGSEGKGQIVAYVSTRQNIDFAVRVGGPNAGHTFLLPNGVKQVVQTVPAPIFIQKPVVGVIGAAGLIIKEVFVREIEEAYKVMERPPNVVLDENVGLITRKHMATEAHLKGNIGSTGEGVGAATAQKVMREPKLIIKHPETLAGLTEEFASNPAFRAVHTHEDTPQMLNSALRGGAHVIIEGTQGVGLSLHTSGHYPFCTSRECTPQGMLSQTGIAHENALRVDKIMVVRTFPIRVGGNSGDLPYEATWEEMKETTGGYVKEAEITTVTKKKRRIARIDYEDLRRAVLITRPTALALTFFDYWFPEVASATDPSAFKKEHWDAINRVEKELDVPVKYLSTGFGTVIPLRVTL